MNESKSKKRAQELVERLLEELNGDVGELLCCFEKFEYYQNQLTEVENWLEEIGGNSAVDGLCNLIYGGRRIDKLLGGMNAAVFRDAHREIESLRQQVTIRDMPYYGVTDHPDGYNGPCACDECLSLGY